MDSQPPKPRDPSWRWHLSAAALEALPPAISIPLWLLGWFGLLARELFLLSPSRLARIAGLLGIAALPLAVLLAALLR